MNRPADQQLILQANHVLPLQACLERLETRTLVASGVLATELRSFDRKIIQTKTGLLFVAPRRCRR